MRQLSASKNSTEERSRKVLEFELKGLARKDANMVSDKVVKEIMQSQPLDYFKVKYEVEVLGPEMMRKQAIMDERKKLYRPIRSDEIEEHNKLHDERLRILTEVKQAYKEQEQKPQYHTPAKSVFYQRVLKRDQKKQIKLIEQAKKKQELIMRKKKYGEYVKQFINNPDVSDYDEDYDEEVYREPAASHQSRDKSYNHGPSRQRSQENLKKDEEIIGRTVRHRKLLYDNLGYGSLIPHGQPQGERSIENDRSVQSKYQSLNIVKKDPYKGYNRDIRSEYKSQFIRHSSEEEEAQPQENVSKLPKRPRAPDPYSKKKSMQR